MEKFRNLVPEKSQVIRNGSQMPMEALEIVIGDIVCLQSGDKVPADCRVIFNSSMRVDQSMITGESEPIEISVDAMDEKPLEARNLIFNGSLVVDGSCLAVAIRTGDYTLIGGMVQLTGDAGEIVSTLKKDVEYFVIRLAIFAFIQGVTVFIVGCARGLDPLNTFISGFIVIILSNVPEGLPSTVTALLYIIAVRMGEQNVFVKKLDVIETLGCCSIICSDKTGTLTMNKMTISNMWLPDREFSSDEFNAEGNNPNAVQLHALKEIAALNSRITMERKTPESELVPSGDATELGLYIYFDKFLRTKTGNSLEHYREHNTKVHEIPFNSSNKWQMSIHKIPEKGREFLFLKGAPDIILTKCSSYLNHEGREVAIDENFMALYAKTYEEFGGRGERALGFAYKEMSSTLADGEHRNPSYKEELKEQLVGKKEGVAPMKDLCFVGIVTLTDPPRPEVQEAINECRTAGVRVVMVTGDHPLTAQAIARKIGLITLPTRESISKDKKIPKEDVNEDEISAVVIHGSTIPDMSDADWDIVLSKQEIVFARTSPEQKLTIVKKFKGKGLITAMTGDGVNDSPALKQADIGIAMGLNGSDVAREAAALVLLDDNFASIVMGIREGRLLYTNLKKSIAYNLAHMTSEVVPILMWAFTGIPLAMTGITVLCIDLITELLPSISLAYEKIESNIMQVPPRDLKTDKLVTLQVAAYSYGQIGVIECGVCWLVWFQVIYVFYKEGLIICCSEVYNFIYYSGVSKLGN
jgi:sodium/potassium-transporting ATPase subunit alpha